MEDGQETDKDGTSDQPVQASGSSVMAAERPEVEPKNDTHTAGETVRKNYRLAVDPSLDKTNKGKQPVYRFSGDPSSSHHTVKDPRVKVPKYGPATSKGRLRWRESLVRCHFPYDKYSVGPKPLPPAEAILVTGFSTLATNSEILRFFAEFGTVDSHELKLDPTTGGSLGICRIVYLSAEKAGTSAKAQSSRAVKRYGNEAAKFAVQKAHLAKFGVDTINVVLDAIGEKCHKAVAAKILSLRPKKIEQDIKPDPVKVKTDPDQSRVLSRMASPKKEVSSASPITSTETQPTGNTSILTGQTGSSSLTNGEVYSGISRAALDPIKPLIRSQPVGRAREYTRTPTPPSEDEWDRRRERRRRRYRSPSYDRHSRSRSPLRRYPEHFNYRRDREDGRYNRSGRHNDDYRYSSRSRRSLSIDSRDSDMDHPVPRRRTRIDEGFRDSKSRAYRTTGRYYLEREDERRRGRSRSRSWDAIDRPTGDRYDRDYRSGRGRGYRERSWERSVSRERERSAYGSRSRRDRSLSRDHDWYESGRRTYASRDQRTNGHHPSVRPRSPVKRSLSPGVAGRQIEHGLYPSRTTTKANDNVPQTAPLANTQLPSPYDSNVTILNYMKNLATPYIFISAKGFGRRIDTVSMQRHLARFTCNAVFYLLGQGYYASFTSDDGALRCHMVLNNRAFLGVPLSMTVVKPRLAQKDQGLTQQAKDLPSVDRIVEGAVELIVKDLEEDLFNDYTDQYLRPYLATLTAERGTPIKAELLSGNDERDLSQSAIETRVAFEPRKEVGTYGLPSFKKKAGTVSAPKIRKLDQKASAPKVESEDDDEDLHKSAQKPGSVKVDAKLGREARRVQEEEDESDANDEDLKGFISKLSDSKTRPEDESEIESKRKREEVGLESDEEILKSTLKPTKKPKIKTAPLSVIAKASKGLEKKPKKEKVPKKVVQVIPQTPTGPPIDAFAEGLAQDPEDLYFLRMLLESQNGPSTLGDALGDGEDGTEESKHESGSARTEGYYKIADVDKGSYLPQRNSAKIDVEVLHRSSSRMVRANNRHLAAGVEMHKKGAATESDVLKFNQLKARKKQLKFARSPIHDWGLFAMERIAANDMVIEYVGEVIRQQIADHREKRYEKMGIGSSYLFRVDDDAVVDATVKGNIARFINHCCAPNCNAKIITLDGQKKIVIYTMRVIEEGEEITYDYSKYHRGLTFGLD